MNITSRIIEWYHENGRDLPWRSTANPYYIWVSEVILQQTRVIQGIGYYHRFIEKFPTIQSLALAQEEDVMKVWQGLGYYSRARNMMFAAKQIEKEYNGVFPQKFEDVYKLKGIGEYTASAIMSFAFNQSYPALDGNVYRFLSRYYGIYEPIDTSSGQKLFRELSFDLIETDHPGVYNQAMIEFGALQCTPKGPDCMKCILNETCVAFIESKIESFPVKKSKVRKKDIYNYYFIQVFNGETLVTRSNDSNIWRGLYLFPNHSSEKEILEDDLKFLQIWKDSIVEGDRLKIIVQDKPYLLSHRNVFARYIIIFKTHELKPAYEEFKKVGIEDLSNLAFPRMIDVFIEKNIDSIIS